MFIKHSECSVQTSSSNSARAFSGGLNGSPEKLYFKVSSRTDFRPVASSLSDNVRSDFKQLRNIV